MVTVPPPEGLQEQICRLAGGFPSQLLGTPRFKEPQTPKSCLTEEPPQQQRGLCVLRGYKCTHTRAFICEQNNMIDFFCYISGDRKEEASAKYFAHAAAAHGVSEEDTAVPPPTTCRSGADTHWGTGLTPDMLQTRGQARQSLTSLGNSGSAGKAKQPGVQLFYKARASLSTLVQLNKSEEDFWRVKKALSSSYVKTSIKTMQKTDVCFCLLFLEKSCSHSQQGGKVAQSQPVQFLESQISIERSPKV